jgi:SAM-dependent methyltransferase
VPNDLKFARCLACGGAPLVEADGVVVCQQCARRYEMAGGVPLLVRDARHNEEELSAARAVNPAWYVEEQPAEMSSPWRHHIDRRRRYVMATLRRELAARGHEKAAHLLDLGCGDGNHTAWLGDFAENIYGSDYNIVRLARARGLNKTATLFLADIMDYPARDGFFDAVFFNHVIEHIPDDASALVEIYRIMAPGGLLILGTPNEGSWWWQLAYRRAPHIRASTDHVHFYTADTLCEKIATAGFKITEVEHTGFGPPDFGWDMRLRQYKVLDTLFEWLGRTFLPRQASSLYVIAEKPGRSLQSAATGGS